MTEFVSHNSQQSNHFLKAQESEMPLSHKILLLAKHICRELFADGIIIAVIKFSTSDIAFLAF